MALPRHMGTPALKLLPEYALRTTAAPDASPVSAQYTNVPLPTVFVAPPIEPAQFASFEAEVAEAPVPMVEGK